MFWMDQNLINIRPYIAVVCKSLNDQGGVINVIVVHPAAAVQYRVGAKNNVLYRGLPAMFRIPPRVGSTIIPVL
jgi:hypothetical protein